MAREDYIDQFRLIGRAALARGLQNSHSGNISVKEWDDQQWKMYITASGSPLGSLVDSDIVPVGFDRTTWGIYRASSENRIHKAILQHPDTFAAMHAHAPISTLLSFDVDCSFLVSTPGKNISMFVPIDIMGAYHLGSVPVEEFEFPVGSEEMVRKIPPCLQDNKVMIVKGHGVFGRGKNLKDVLYGISLLEYSATVLMYARLLDVDIRSLQQQVTSNLRQLYPVAPSPYLCPTEVRFDTQDKSHLEQFRWAGEFIYNQGLSPFHTGSMSIRVGKTVLYCAGASTPDGLPCSIFRLPLDIAEGDSPELIIHKQIYQGTRFNAIIHTLSPESAAESFAVTASGKDILYPIDAEASYINPRVAVCDCNPAPQVLIRKLHSHKNTVIVKGQGMWSTGKNTLEQAMHNPASAKTFSYLRIHNHLLHKLGLFRSVQFQENRLRRE